MSSLSKLCSWKFSWQIHIECKANRKIMETWNEITEDNNKIVRTFSCLTRLDYRTTAIWLSVTQDVINIVNALIVIALARLLSGQHFARFIPTLRHSKKAWLFPFLLNKSGSMIVNYCSKFTVQTIEPYNDFPYYVVSLLTFVYCLNSSNQ